MHAFNVKGEILRKENATLQQQLLARDDEIKTLIAEKQYLKEQQSNLTDDMWPLSSQDTKPGIVHYEPYNIITL